MTYRPHIDGVRAIAVLAVVLYHAGAPGVGSGYVGVDVFFVISGYLITALLFREAERTGDIWIRDFMVRRIRRLLPAMAVVLMATLIAGFFILSPIGGEQQNQAKSVLATLGLVANLYFWRKTGGYFDDPTDSQTLLHMWSLSVEEQFYLVWPWLILAAFVWAKRRGTTGFRATAGLLLAVFVVSLIGCIVLTHFDREAAFFLTPARAWEFAAGGAVFLLLRRTLPSASVANALSLLGLLAVLTSAALIPASMIFPGWVAVWPVIGSALLIYGTEANACGPVARLLSLRPMVWLGLISYSLYLWHWPLLSVAKIEMLDEITLAQKLALCSLAVLLAWLTYRFVENPIRQKKWSAMVTPRQSLQTGAAIVVAVMLCAVSMGAWAKWVWPSIPSNRDLALLLSGLNTPKLPDCVQPRPFGGQLVAAEKCDIPDSHGDPDIWVWGGGLSRLPLGQCNEGLRRGGAPPSADTFHGGLSTHGGLRRRQRETQRCPRLRRIQRSRLDKPSGLPTSRATRQPSSEQRHWAKLTPRFSARAPKWW